MSRSLHKVSVLVRSYFSVFDTADAAVTGLLDGAFTKVLSKDGASSAVAVTVAEIGSGKYVASFTPDGVATWDLRISHATHNPRGWQATYDVTTDGPLAAGAAMALTSAERDSISNALLDLANGVETSYTVRQTLRLMAAVLCGKASGGPGSPVFRNLADTANRVSSTADSNGNRSAVTLSP